ncbi:MAG: hypothetical protein HQK51_15085, partial [Oligoflexia bacterium]|nr:hypothetical protein [Oligoflexia bacterium]
HISRLKELIKEYVEIESAVLGSIRYSNEIQSSVSRKWSTGTCKSTDANFRYYN